MAGVKKEIDNIPWLKGRLNKASAAFITRAMLPRVQSEVVPVVQKAFRSEAPRGDYIHPGMSTQPGHKKLQDSITAKATVSGSRVIVSVDAPKHAKWITEGTQPHMIPTDYWQSFFAGGHRLHFWWHKEGRYSNPYLVSHPGIVNPSNFNIVAADKARAAINRLLIAALRTQISSQMNFTGKP